MTLHLVFALGALAFQALIAVFVILRMRRNNLRQVVSKSRARTPAPAGPDVIDVAIVGAGPAGSTCAWYLAHRYHRSVVMFDRAKFPRVKLCGDAWCAPALNIMEEMGVLDRIHKDKIFHSVQRGGFVSPSGFECINRGETSYGSVTGCRTYAIKRVIADEYLVRAAQEVGVDVREETEVKQCVLGDDGVWTVTVESGKVVRSRMLVICDGATSYLAKKLGIVPADSQPEATCSNQYVRGDTHAWTDADGVMLFNNSVLPGYSAMFRHYNNDVYLGTYILPGGAATSRAIVPFEKELCTLHPYVSTAFGTKFEFRERVRVAPIRLSVAKSYGEQVLVVGDAAGQVDPLTGEGIHTAMIGAKIAAETISQMFENGDFSSQSCRAYHYRCHDAFGQEFVYSALAARVIVRFPLVLDAMAVVGAKRGQAFLDFFGEVMTGVRPKSAFLQPGLLVALAFEVIRQIILQKILRRPPCIPSNIGVDIVQKQARSKQE